MKQSYGCLNFPQWVHFSGPYYHILACISKSFLQTLREVCDTGSHIWLFKSAGKVQSKTVKMFHRKTTNSITWKTSVFRLNANIPFPQYHWQYAMFFWYKVSSYTHNCDKNVLLITANTILLNMQTQIANRWCLVKH